MSTITSTTHTKADEVAISYSGRDGGLPATGQNAKPLTAAERKYNHAYAIHAKSKVSPLSAGADPAPNFIGFRNLMILMLSMLAFVPIANLIRTCADRICSWFEPPLDD